MALIPDDADSIATSVDIVHFTVLKYSNTFFKYAPFYYKYQSSPVGASYTLANFSVCVLRVAIKRPLVICVCDFPSKALTINKRTSAFKNKISEYIWSPLLFYWIL